MKQTLMTRRAFLASATGAVVIVSLPGCLAATGLNDAERNALVRMARLLYPHAALQDKTYERALQSLLTRAETEPMVAADLQAGVSMLTHLANGDWLAGTHDDQIEVLERIEEGAFFKLIQAEVKWQLYEKDPVVWELIGYEGPSVGFGGYLNRGFDDIDWLPED